MDGRVRKPKPHPIGVQIRHGVYSKCRRLYEQLSRPLGGAFVARVATVRPASASYSRTKGSPDAAASLVPPLLG